MEREEIKNQIEVGDRITFIQTTLELGRYRGLGCGFATKEVKNKVVEIVTSGNREFKEVLKIERIGTNGWYTVYEKEEEILDKKEKKYLKAVIKPFRKNIKYIVKIRHSFDTREYLRIILEDCNTGALPDFEPGTMYKNMKNGKEYSLKELGLE